MGVALSTISEIFPPPSTFSVDDIPDLTGRVIVITGANTGIGKETAKALLAHNAKVYIAARSKTKAYAAIEDLKQQTGRTALFLHLDLADLYAIKSAAEEFLSREKELHVLFNNGGVFVPPMDQLTAQGYDLQFGTNVLGHWYLTKLLLPALLAGAKSSPDGKARVVNSSSTIHLISGIDFNTLRDTPKRRKQYLTMLYAQSKFGNVVFSSELARRYGDQGIVSTSLNPGSIQSDMQRHLSFFEKQIIGLVLHPTSYGALTQLYAGTSVEGAGFNGRYLIPWARLHSPRRTAEDPKIGRELWEWAEDQVANI